MWKRFGIVAVMVVLAMAMAGCTSDKASVTLPDVQANGMDSKEKPGQTLIEDTSMDFETEAVTEYVPDESDDGMGEEVFEIEGAYGGSGGADVEIEAENVEAVEQAYEEYMQHTQELQHDIVNGNIETGEQTVAPGNNSY